MCGHKVLVQYSQVRQFEIQIETDSSLLLLNAELKKRKRLLYKAMKTNIFLSVIFFLSVICKLITLWF